MIPFPSIEGLTTFPYPEGIQFEFKKTFTSVARSVKTKDKLYQTICAFLNTQGGYLIYGIDDETREIHGVPITKSKELDAFLLKVDNIYHSNILMQENGTPLVPGTVVATIVPVTKYQTHLCIVKVTPTPGVTCIFHSGEKYVRLSASNYHVNAKHSCVKMRRKEYIKIINITKQITMTQTHEPSHHDFTLTKQYYLEQTKLYQQMAEDVTVLLYSHILHQKDMKEKELKAQKEKEKEITSCLPLCWLLM